MKSTSVTRLRTVRVEILAFGIRFGPRWRLVDELGPAIDKILYSEDTSFGPDVLPESAFQGTKRILVKQSPDSGKPAINQLTLSERDCILNMRVETADGEELSMEAVVRAGGQVLLDTTNKGAPLGSLRWQGRDSGEAFDLGVGLLLIWTEP